jgi:hypothetical protein
LQPLLPTLLCEELEPGRRSRVSRDNPNVQLKRKLSVSAAAVTTRRNNSSDLRFLTRMLEVGAGKVTKQIMT